LLLSTMTRTRNAPLKLFVYILGLDDCSFTVKIKRSETVDDLKKAILGEANDLGNVNSARRLVLYKVDVPDCDDLERRVPQVPREELRVASRKLSNIFETDPPDETVSIIVKRPGIGE
jgi:hypothetical protein